MVTVTVDLLGEALIEVVLAAVKVFLLGGLFDAVPDRLEDDGDAPVEGGHVGFPEDGDDRVGGHGLAELFGEGFGAVVEEQERFQGGGPDEAALEQGCQDGEFIVEGSPEASTVVQMNGEGVVAEDLERFVVMAVHVAGEEVEDGHVHEV